MPDLLIDGYISQSFHPNKDAEDYLCYLLKTNQAGLRQSCLTLPAPDNSGVIFVARGAPNTFAPRPLTQDQSGYPLWLLDHSVVRMGTVVPQSLWSPKNVNDQRQYVAEAPLELPIFFTHENGVLGLPLNDAAKGRCHTLCDARMQAPLGGKHTTYIRILVSTFGLVILHGICSDDTLMPVSGQVTMNISDKSRYETRRPLKIQSQSQSSRNMLVALWRPSSR